ncbi:MAG TPA: PQQ-binding-like beta-propeller repeat protein [Steroidobacteraceae bacterium]
MRTLTAALRVLVALSSFLACSCKSTPSAEWPTYQHDSNGTRYSPVAEITPANVSSLRIAWIYHMRPPNFPDMAVPQDEHDAGDAGNEHGPGHFAVSEATPLVVHGLMYVSTPYGRVVALNSDTGQEIWAYDLPDGDKPATRGVEYWPGDRDGAAEILFGTRAGKLIALSARSGTPVAGFGKNGVVEMKTPEVMNGKPAAALGMSSTPLIYRNLAITGSRVQETPTLGAAGDVRAWDVRTGKLVWTFHSVPRPGEIGHDTWEGDSWKNRSGVNVWSFLVLDRARGILYMPFGAPTFDRWGGDRKGTNLFANAVVAVEAATGRYLWHFQTVHHDIWDLDLPSATLVDVKRAGKTVAAIAVMNKSSLLFILDRVTGKPLYEVKEMPVPTDTDIPSEAPWPTQPMPVTPPPLARQSFRMSELASITPDQRAACQKLIEQAHVVDSRPFQPFRADSAVASFPGSVGGTDWGGAAFDPHLGYYIVNTSDLASPEQLVQDPDGTWSLKYGYVYFWDYMHHLPCQQPPWGSLYAIDVNTGQIAWRSTLGISDTLPEGQRDTGRPSAGGPIVTAGGLIFIGGTDDDRIRAFDTRSGAELWTFKLPASIYGTPITYRGRNGHQYVAAVDTGGFMDSPIASDAVVAFSLPRATGAHPLEQTASTLTPQAVTSQTPPDGPTLLQRSCVSCHDLRTITSQHKSPQEWVETVAKMANRGAEVTPEEFRAIVGYLIRTFPAAPSAAGSH